LLKIDTDEHTSMDNVFLQKVTKYILQNLPNADMNVDDLANEALISTRQLHRKVLALTGATPNKFIRSIRLHRAAEMLNKQSGTVTEIAFDVGFNNLSWFAKCFKEEFGVLPSEYHK